jgi:hypothetical protein
MSWSASWGKAAKDHPAAPSHIVIARWPLEFHFVASGDIRYINNGEKIAEGIVRK